MRPRPLTRVQFLPSEQPHSQQGRHVVNRRRSTSIRALQDPPPPPPSPDAHQRSGLPYLDTYSSIGHGLQSGPTLAFSLWLSYFKTKTSFGLLVKKIRGRVFYFFEKSKNELVRPKTVFLAILAKIRSFFDNSDIIANSQYTSV